MDTRHMLSVAALGLFAFCALGTSKAKDDSSGSSTKTTSASSGDGPSKENELVGSCDRSDTFYKDCTENYTPLSKTAAEAKKSCDSLGGKFHLGGCPRIGALSQCFEGNPGYLSASYKYEGTKRKADPDMCKRGFKDFSKTPALTVNSNAASCNMIAAGGTCSQYSAVTADVERSCLNGGGEIKQPPEPCPTANVLAAYKIPLKDGTLETESFYTTPYKDATGTHTWTAEDIAIICGLTGKCTKVDVAAPTSAATTGAASAGAAKKPDLKKK